MTEETTDGNTVIEEITMTETENEDLDQDLDLGPDPDLALLNVDLLAETTIGPPRELKQEISVFFCLKGMSFFMFVFFCFFLALLCFAILSWVMRGSILQLHLQLPI